MAGTVIPETMVFRSSVMQTGAEQIGAVRQEILELLRQQMEALDSPLGLTDARLSECYERQARVQELRETLQALSSSKAEAEPAGNQATERQSPPRQVIPVRLDSAANV